MHFLWYTVGDKDIRIPQKKLLMVTGDSGYSTHNKFLAFAYLDEVFRPSLRGELRWLSVTNDELSDSGWRPTHWTWPINVPGLSL